MINYTHIEFQSKARPMFIRDVVVSARKTHDASVIPRRSGATRVESPPIAVQLQHLSREGTTSGDVH